MKGTVNMSQVKEQGSIEIPEPAVYDVEITEKRDGNSSNGDPIVAIKLTILSGPYQDSWVWDNILIPPLSSPAAKILGRSKHFLHCIGEPYEGEELKWDSDNWIGKQCKIRTDIEPPNQYHKRPKAIVVEYVFDEELHPVDEEESPF